MRNHSLHLISKNHLPPRSERILNLLSEYFCLRVQDVAKLIKDRDPTETDLRNTRRGLELLWKKGLAHRLVHFEPHPNCWKGSNKWVYGLTDKAVKEFGGKTFDEHSERTLDHELEISLFHMELKKFCERKNLKLYWQQSDLKRGIHPDAYFAIITPKLAYPFFLEIEKQRIIGRSSNEEPKIIKKLTRFAEYYNTDQCAKDWNFRTFRVVVVSKSQTVRDNLHQLLKQKLPHSFFMLTTEKLARMDIGASIFKKPTNDDIYPVLVL
jgi:hypothetical protein